MDDPYRWSIERVVQELCTSQRSWEPEATLKHLPEPISAALEHNLRDQEVDGCMLLRHVPVEVMKEDLGLVKLSHRAFVMDAIEIFRLRSNHYQQWQAAHNTGSNAFSHFTSNRMVGFLPQQIQVPPTPPVQAQQLPTIPNPTDPQLGQALAALVDSRATRGEFVFTDEQGNKRRKLDLTKFSSNLALQEEDDAFYDTTLYQEETPQSEISPPPPTAEDAVVNDKKRKRIAPTLITSEIDPDRNRDIPTAADNVVQFDPQNVEPGVTFHGKDGRKHLVPIHQPDADTDEPYDYQALLNRSRTSEAEQGAAVVLPQSSLHSDRKRAQTRQESEATGYLGRSKLGVDDIFYGETLVGQELALVEDPVALSGKSRAISGGRRRYVARVMKRFLRTERVLFHRNDNYFSAIQPYAPKFVATHAKPSFTLYYASEDGQIRARREEVKSWPEMDPEASFRNTELDIHENGVTFNVSTSAFLDGIGKSDPLAPDLLEKYRYIDGGDEVLPLYGESDEENEFDMETWKEIEEERGLLNRPSRPLAHPPITADEIEGAIDDGIAEIVEKWRKRRLPQKQRKAYKIWKKYRPRELRREQLRKRHAEVDHVTQRITGLRQEIAKDIWTSQEQVRKQTRILEPSIFDRQDWSWEVRLLESKQQPEKLPPLARSEARLKKSVITDDGEEGESLESYSNAASSDDGLSDFVAQDSLRSEDEQELNLADSEDESDGAISDASLPNLAQKAPTSRKLFQHLPAHSSQALLGNDEEMPDVPNNEPHAPSDSDSNIAMKGEASLPKLPVISSKFGTPTESYIVISSDDSPVAPPIDLTTPKKKAMLKLNYRNGPVVISDSEGLDPENLPKLQDTAAIAKHSHRTWTGRKDRERLLISVLHGMPGKMRNSVFVLMSQLEKQIWASIIDVISAIRNEKEGVKGMDTTTFNNICVLIRLFAMFVKCKYFVYVERPNKGQAHDLRFEAEQFPDFYNLLHKIETFFEKYTSSDPSSQQRAIDNDEDEDEEPQPSVRRRQAVNSTDNDGSDPEQETPHKLKRKYKVIPDKNARDLRERNHERQAAQKERRQRLLESQAGLGDSQGAHGEIIINESKLDNHDFVYVNSKISRRIKQHQVEGVQFMWNQIVTVDAVSDEDGEGGSANDASPLSGCLLAHTMGLGKTMQVITLLVAIADASKSPRLSTFSQIPLRLREPKTLILCPASLIENWTDELLLWAPEGVLGELRKIDQGLKPHIRVGIVDDWFHDGGVLVIGYEMFRNLISNTKRKGAESAVLDDEQHAQVKHQLLEGPNIIVADEAHKLKNATSAVTKAASQFRSTSRIALTGSPLANNVEEYHSMIEWVSPNYLGPAVEFRAKYVEPIQAGLYHDSSSYERRKALQMLGVLNEEVSPLVHRRDMSVLRNDLPPKKEFVITVPLTELQRKAYSIYVRSMENSAHRNEEGEVAQTTLWNWLAILSLLCNHPASFMNKLNQREEAAKKSAKAGTPRDDQEDLHVDLNTADLGVGVSQSLLQAEQKLFDEECADMDSIELSNKTKILCKILDAAQAADDKTLVFSQSIPTLNFLEQMCINQNRKYSRLDGSTAMAKRQTHTKNFNSGDTEIYLISTTAGGLGLNLWGANRVVIFDFKFNPILEEQAVGRAYRIGQQKDVFVYRFVAGGTFEDAVHNKAIFKKQLASRVVDKKKVLAWAKKKLGDFLFEPKEVEQMDLAKFEGSDPEVLDLILSSQGDSGTVRAIVETDTFELDDSDDLTPAELKVVKQMASDEKLKRENPTKYYQLLAERSQQLMTSNANAHRASLQTLHTAPVSFIPSAQQPPVQFRHFSGNHVGFVGPQREQLSTAVQSQLVAVPASSSAPSLAVNRTSMATLSSPAGFTPGIATDLRNSPSIATLAAPAPRPNGSTESSSGPPATAGGFDVHSKPLPTAKARSAATMAAPTSSAVSTPEALSSRRPGLGSASNDESASTKSAPNAKTQASSQAQGSPLSDVSRGSSRVHVMEMDVGTGDIQANKQLKSEMFKAMNKRPQTVNSLRTPVTKQKSKSSRHTSLKPSHLQSRSTSSSSSTSSTNKAKLPKWAAEAVAKAQSEPGVRGSPASSSRTSTPKE